MRKISCLLFITILFFSCTKLGDFIPLAPAPQFNKVYGGSSGEYAWAITESFNGGYVFAGYTQSNDEDVSGYHGGQDVWIVKVDNNGKILWQRALGGSGFDYASAITKSLDGGYVMAGSTGSNDGDISGYHGNGDAWIVKLDNAGNILWQKILGGTSLDDASSITVTLDGGYIVAGYTQSNEGDVSGYHGGQDAWIVKLDNSGSILWQKSLGGTGEDKATSISVALDGGYVMAGYTTSNDGDVSGYHGRVDAWIVKLGDNGKIKWQKTIEGLNIQIVRLITVVTSIDGGCVIAAVKTNKNRSHPHPHPLLVKLNDNGDVQWEREYSTTSISNDFVRSITRSIDGGYVFAGEAYNNGSVDAWVVKIDKNGNKQWQRLAGGSDYDIATSITNTYKGGYVISGGTFSNDGDISGQHGNGDAWVMTLKDQ